MTLPRWTLSLFLISCLLCGIGAAFASDTTVRVSVNSAGVEGNGCSPCWPSISGDGTYVAFMSVATNLVAGDTNGNYDVFVRGRLSSTTERVSLNSAEVEGNGDSGFCSISADGRFVAFESSSSNLVAGDSNEVWDVFVRDRLLGTTERVSLSSAEAQGNGDSLDPSITADGRYVAFTSCATDLVASDTNEVPDVFVRDRLLGTTERVSLSATSTELNDCSKDPSISADGRYIAFETDATDTGTVGDIAIDPNYRDILVRDRTSATTELISQDPGGCGVCGDCYHAQITADGRYVAFETADPYPIGGPTYDTNGVSDVFLWDRNTTTMERVSIGAAGAEGNAASWAPSVDSDGSRVAFVSEATNLVTGDTNLSPDVFLRDRQAVTTTRVSLTSTGSESNGTSYYNSMDADGDVVAFASSASNLVFRDANEIDDIFVRAIAPFWAPHVLLKVHPNERAPGAAGPLLGDPYWTAPGAVSTGGYTWKTYNFAGGAYLWIQVCAQAQRASNTPSGKPDRLQMLVDGVILSDYWADNMAAPPNYQWNGNFALDMGRRKTLRFLSIGVPGAHTIRFKAVQYPLIWWIKVTDLEPQMIEAPG